MRISRKKIMTAICFAAMTTFFVGIGYKELQQNTPVLAQSIQANGTPDYGYKRAEIALQEFHKNVVETNPGCECGTEINLYTDNHPAQWCTMFASWVAKEAGTSLWSDKTKSWRISNSRDFATYLQAHGTWFSHDQTIKQGLVPQPGDFIVTWRGEFDQRLGHVDIVIAAHDKTADLIGGNIADRILFRKDVPYKDDYGFLGFGRPEKP